MDSLEVLNSCSAKLSSMTATDHDQVITNELASRRPSLSSSPEPAEAACSGSVRLNTESPIVKVRINLPLPPVSPWPLPLTQNTSTNTSKSTDHEHADSLSETILEMTTARVSTADPNINLDRSRDLFSPALSEKTELYVEQRSPVRVSTETVIPRWSDPEVASSSSSMTAP